MSYNYTKVGKFSNNLTFNGWDIPLTQKSFLITYDGKLKAGVKMDKIEVAINNNIITVSIPEIEILSNEIDESSIEVYDETKMYSTQFLSMIILPLLKNKKKQ